MLCVDWFCDDPVHVSGFGRGDCCVSELDTMFHIEAVPFHF